MDKHLIVSNTEEEFQENRSKGIGSSDIAAVLGLDPYRSPYQLWHDKTGRGEKFEGNRYTIAGHRLEPVVVEYFADETGANIKTGFEGNVHFVHPVHSFAVATPDRPYEREGIHGVLECKTAHRYIDPDLPPEYWFCQNQYQAAIMNACGYVVNECAIAWLQITPGLPFHHLLFDYQPEFGDYLINMAGEFWEKHVVKDTPPPRTKAEDVELEFARHQPGKVIRATDELAGEYARLVDVRGRIKELQEEEEAIKNNFKMIMKDAEAVEYFDQTIITWKAPKPSRRVDTKRLKEEAPEVYEEYSREITPTRRFLVKD